MGMKMGRCLNSISVFHYLVVVSRIRRLRSCVSLLTPVITVPATATIVDARPMAVSWPSSLKFPCERVDFWQEFTYPKDPDPSKLAIFRTLPLRHTGSNPFIAGSLVILRVGNFEKTGHRVMLLDDAFVATCLHEGLFIISWMFFRRCWFRNPANTLGPGVFPQPVGTGHGVNYLSGN